MFDFSHFFTSGGYGIWVYALVFIIAFGESLAFIGIIIPGSIALITAGALASQGVFEVGALFFWSSLGAILGDGFSYFLGRRGWIQFRPTNKLFTAALLEKGKYYFKQHGSKSVFFGRFIGWVRPVVPFVAGVFSLDIKVFLLWNITSGILWSLSHIAIGYFFGSAISFRHFWRPESLWFLLLALAVATGLYGLSQYTKQRKSG